MRTQPTLALGVALLLCTLAHADPPPANLPSSFTLHVKCGSISQDVHFTWDGGYGYDGWADEGKDRDRTHVDAYCRVRLYIEPYTWEEYYGFHCWFYVEGGNLCTVIGRFDPETAEIIIEHVNNGGQVWVVN